MESNTTPDGDQQQNKPITPDPSNPEPDPARRSLVKMALLLAAGGAAVAGLSQTAHAEPPSLAPGVAGFPASDTQLAVIRRVFGPQVAARVRSFHVHEVNGFFVGDLVLN